MRNGLIVASLLFLAFWGGHGYQFHIRKSYAAFSQQGTHQLHSVRRLRTSLLEKKSLQTSYFSSDELILDDFDEIVDSLMLFRSIYGNFNIPLKFEVPSEPPWPVHLHGLRLGKRLERILASPSFYSKHPDKVRKFTSIGFSQNQFELLDDWNFIFGAFQCYKTIFGNLRMPTNFVVPDSDPRWPRIFWQLKLGNKVSAIRSAGSFVKGFPDRKLQLDRLGFEWKVRQKDTSFRESLNREISLDSRNESNLNDDDDDTLFLQFCDVFEVYRKVHRHGEVELNYEVPHSPSYAAELHGFPLGKLAGDIVDSNRFLKGKPKNIELLYNLGFIWPQRLSKGIDLSLNDIIGCLLQFKKVYGHSRLPNVFIIPAEFGWPQSAWGVDLVANLRNLNAEMKSLNLANTRELFSFLSFDLSNFQLPVSSSIISLDNDDDESLEYSFSKQPKFSFMIPIHDISEVDSKMTMGPKKKLLGHAAEELSLMGEDINEIIFQIPRSTFDFDMTYMFENSPRAEWASSKVIQKKVELMNSKSTKRYKAYFDWQKSPSELGQSFLNSLGEEDIEISQRLGYRILDFGEFCWDDFLAALRIYFEMNGHTNVPLDFVVVEGVLGFDAYCSIGAREMQLGKYVHEIRIGDIDGFEDPPRRQLLDEMDFIWGDTSKYLKFRFLPFYAAMRVHYHLNGYGTPGPEYDFVVPRNDPTWPHWMAGIPLGKWKEMVKIQKCLLEEHYPVKKELIDSLDFMWWWPISPQYYDDEAKAQKL